MSKSPRALVTGATGLLGRQAIKAFENENFDVVGTGYSRATPPVQKLDIQDEHAVNAFFDEVKPRIVIHCAADRQPDSCTRDPTAARRLNVTATTNLARLCTERNIFLIYISTDYVFPGQPGEAPYAAQAKPNPPNVYGETKLEGEQQVLQHTPVNGAVILRVPVLYGETDPKDNNKESAVNILMDALWKANQKIHTDSTPDPKQTVQMDDWAIRYPTNTQDVARVCVDIVKLYTSSSQKELPRILQFSSEDRMTKYEIMAKFADIMGLSMTDVVADKDGGKPGPDGTMRPYDCHLSTRELKDLGVDVSTVDFVAWWRRYVGAFRH